jgi:uncharacterized repeat protein (TIGR04076 family)
MPVKVTVKKGTCHGGFHKMGQSFLVDWKTPDSMCMGAWDAVSPFVLTLLCGGRFPWEKEAGVTEIHCPDPKGITLELRRMED